MKRKEACERLSMIASDEIISSCMSSKLFAIRDNIMNEKQSCPPEQQADCLMRFVKDDLLSAKVRNEMQTIADCIINNSFEKEPLWHKF